jgi:hypothetical protein
MRVDNQPYGRLNEIIYDHAFTVHPYKHPTIGSMADLEAASIDDVREFFATYYVPNNATLDAGRRLRLEGGAEAGAAVPRPRPPFDRPVPRDIPKEPPQTKERRVTVEEPGRCRPSSWRTTCLRRASGRLPAAHRVEGALRRAEFAHLPSSWCTRSGWRWPPSAAATSSSTRTSSTPSRSCSRGRRRRRDQRAHRRARQAAPRADHARRSCSGRRTSSRATTSSAASRTSDKAGTSRTPW